MSSQNITLPDLGPVFTAQQVADYLQLDVNTVRKYYKQPPFRDKNFDFKT